MSEHDGAVGQGQRRAQVVGGEKDCAALVGRCPQRVDSGQGGPPVQPERGLVGQQAGPFVGEHRGQADAALLPTGQPERVLVGQVLQSVCGQRLVHPLVGRCG